MKQKLPTLFKGRYPFRLACPSFIYPAGYVDNVRKLCASVDEIELLLLESAPDALPRVDEIRELSSLAADNHIGFNVHLPTDVPLAAGPAGTADSAVDAVLRAVDLARPLAPVSYTLHVPLTEPLGPGDEPHWQERVKKSLERLLAVSGLPAEAIAIETLDYPLDCLAPVIRELGLSVCLDTGHLMVRGESCRACFQTWQDRIVIIHTHGVDQGRGRDHLPLDRLSPAQSQEIIDILAAFHQSVSLEVFSLPFLAASLIYLDSLWQASTQLNND